MSRVVEWVVPSRLGGEFRKLLAGSWLSNLGDGISLAASPLLVASQTHDPLLVALAPMLQQLPWLLFGLYAGTLADRLDRRVIVMVANAGRVALLAVLVAFLVTGHVSIVVILAVVFFFGIAETFADTTSSTLVPMVVDKQDLGVANARLYAGFITVNQLAGPPIGAALFAVGRAWPFVTEIVCLALALLVITRLRLPAHGTRREDRESSWHEIREGVSWLWHHSAVRTLTIVILTFNVTFGAAWSVLVLYATVHLGMTAFQFGLLTTTAAAGGIVATLSYEWLERHLALGTLMKICLVLEVFLHLSLALNHSIWVAYLILFVFGCYAFVWGTLSSAVRQRAVPMHFQGRVASVYLVGVFAGMVVGQLAGGLIARQWGLTAPYWVAFAATGVFLVVVWPWLKLIEHADEEALSAP